MKLHRFESGQINLITAYDKRSVTVVHTSYDSSFVVTPERVLSDWRPRHGSELIEADVRVVADLEPEVVLLGTGDRLCMPNTEVVAPLRRRGIGVEIMTTAAACRTYNIVAAEGRKVAAALIVERGGL